MRIQSKLSADWLRLALNLSIIHRSLINVPVECRLCRTRPPVRNLETASHKHEHTHKDKSSLQVHRSLDHSISGTSNQGEFVSLSVPSIPAKCANCHVDRETANFITTSRHQSGGFVTAQALFPQAMSTISRMRLRETTKRPVYIQSSRALKRSPTASNCTNNPRPTTTWPRLRWPLNHWLNYHRSVFPCRTFYRNDLWSASLKH